MEEGRLDHRGIALAWRRLAGRSPTVVFLPGYRSDMTGDKAMALADLCAGRGQAMLRFDYSGHGVSGGRFADGTIGAWLADTLAVVDALTKGALVLVGSSMGAGSACWRPWRVPTVSPPSSASPQRRTSPRR